MKTRLHKRLGRSARGYAATALGFALLLAALPIRADTSFTCTGWLSAVPVPGITCTNSSGQVFLKGNSHVMHLLSDDARVTGRLVAWMDVAYQPDGTAIFAGPAYAEVGTWDASGTNFTPSGGVWTISYNGVTQADGRSQYSMTGYGMGGSIESLRLSATATREAPGGPADPYLVSGTISPAPAETRVVVDDFADNQFTWTRYAVGPYGQDTGTFFASETNQELTIGGTWPSTTPRMADSVAWGNPHYDWAVSAGQTVELRVDVVALSQTASMVVLELWHTSDSGQAYGVVVGRNYIAIAKEEGASVAFLRGVQAPIKDTNIVLSVALTPVRKNVVLVGKVLNKDNDALIAQVVATDTPASDPTLSASQLAELTGGRAWQGLTTDPTGAPYTSGSAPVIFVGQESDVAPVTAFATFDNLELRTYEVPQVAIERAVRVSWPDTGMNYSVEAAPTLRGPWLKVQDNELPGMQSITLPAGDPMKFIRLQQAP